jgi:hypothetical protein
MLVMSKGDHHSLDTYHFAEITWVVLVHVRAVMVLASSETTPAWRFTMLANSAMAEVELTKSTSR